MRTREILRLRSGAERLMYRIQRTRQQPADLDAMVKRFQGKRVRRAGIEFLGRNSDVVLDVSLHSVAATMLHLSDDGICGHFLESMRVN